MFQGWSFPTADTSIADIFDVAIAKCIPAKEAEFAGMGEMRKAHAENFLT